MAVRATALAALAIGRPQRAALQRQGDWTSQTPTICGRGCSFRRIADGLRSLLVVRGGRNASVEISLIVSSRVAGQVFFSGVPAIARDGNNAFSAAKLMAGRSEKRSGMPDDSDPNTTTWLVTDVAEVPFLLIVTSISKGSDLRAICAVENPDAPVALVTFALENTLGAEVRLGSHIEGDLTIDEWLIDGNAFRVSLTTRTQPEARGVRIVGLQLTNTVSIIFTTLSILFPIIVTTIIAILVIVYVRRSYRVRVARTTLPSPFLTKKFPKK